ncbi:hypothetical protein Tco_1015445 [Tanacetum coccineum]|uniref:Uncharacterized protein n=1 Tax=Tanacetum coccineum TaxID=301880 RepID=A0ABQ5FKT8_9ASTR
MMSMPGVSKRTSKGVSTVYLVLEGFFEQHKPAVDAAAIRQAIDKLKTREQGTSSAGICGDRKSHDSKEWK